MHPVAALCALRGLVPCKFANGYFGGEYRIMPVPPGSGPSDAPYGRLLAFDPHHNPNWHVFDHQMYGYVEVTWDEIPDRLWDTLPLHMIDQVALT